MKMQTSQFLDAKQENTKTQRKINRFAQKQAGLKIPTDCIIQTHNRQIKTVVKIKVKKNKQSGLPASLNHNHSAGYQW